MDFNSLSEDEFRCLAAIAYPQVSQRIGGSADRASICEGLSEKGFLDRLRLPGAINESYRMQLGVQVGFCQWYEEKLNEAP